MRLVANKQQGFTLIEVIVALTMFGVIMTAVTFAVSAVLQASQRSQQRLNASTDARGLLSFLGHDLQAAFASTQNPSSVFIGNGGDGANNSIGNMGVLTLATSLHRIDAPELDDTGSSTAQPASPNGQGMSPPQSDVEMIRYDFDPETKVVSRQHSGVPNLKLLAQQTSLPETVIARNVLEFRLRFWDAESRQWRQSWDFQQANQKTEGAGASGQGNGGNNSKSNNSETKGDDMLPSAVEITITIRQSDGSPSTYTTVIPIHATQPLSKPPPPPTQGTYSSDGGNNSPNPNDNNGNSNLGNPNSPVSGTSP